MTASVFIATSLDGFIARTNGAIDWLPEVVEDHGYNEFIAAIDAFVMGRNTFETVLGFDVWPFGERHVVVLSSRPSEIVAPAGARCEAMSGTPHEVVARLAARGVNRLYVDGGVTIQRFLAADLIDRMIITRIPVLLGSGIPLFGFLDHDVAVTHVGTRTFPSGLVQSEYVVRRDAPVKGSAHATP